MLNVHTNVDSETLVEVDDGLVKIELAYIGEGYNGDYDANDAEDKKLLRFYVYVNANHGQKADADWEAVEDASYCTNIPVDGDVLHLLTVARDLHKAFRKEIKSYPVEVSVKKLAERLNAPVC